jgi:hypothetical protein
MLIFYFNNLFYTFNGKSLYEEKEREREKKMEKIMRAK